jgi:hypothetical protein
VNNLHVAAAAVIIATGLVHSILGQQRIMSRVATNGAIDPRIRRALGFTWHLAGLLMVVTGVTVGWPGTPARLIDLIGATYVALGMLSLWMTRGRHISGPLFTIGGLLALAA